jgi:gas vesicle protein
MGIMLLLTLMMALQVNVSPGTGMDDAMQTTVRKLTAESQRLLRDTAALEAKVQEQLVEMNSNALVDSAILKKSRDQLSADLSAAQTDLNRVQDLSNASAERLKDVGDEFQERQADAKEARRLQQETQEIQKQLQELRSGDRKIYNAHDSAAKTCWLLELSSVQEIKVARIGEAGSPRVFTDVGKLLTWIQTVSSDDVAFMVLLKPDAAGLFDQISETLIPLGIPFGFDLLPQNATAFEGPEEGRAE